MEEIIKNYIEQSIRTKEEILKSSLIVSNIQKSAEILIETYKNGGKVFLAGNGGSAADSQHIATELVSKFFKERKPLNAMALTTNTSAITAIGNDYGYEYVFSRQLEAYSKKGDIFVAISTSGNSENIIEALKKAKDLGLKTIGFAGKNGGKMESFCDLIIKVPSTVTPTIQESHIMIGHLICAVVEKELFN